MACACNKRKTTKYVWTSLDGKQTKTFERELAARAKATRLGGTVKPIPS